MDKRIYKKYPKEILSKAANRFRADNGSLIGIGGFENKEKLENYVPVLKSSVI